MHDSRTGYLGASGRAEPNGILCLPSLVVESISALPKPYFLFLALQGFVGPSVLEEQSLFSIEPLETKDVDGHLVFFGADSFK